jgi:galactokinase
VNRLSSNFERVHRGADIAFAADLPPDAGMSSSSALVVATFIALSKANDLRSNTIFRSVISSGEELAAYLGAVEKVVRSATCRRRRRGNVGGNQDQTAILCANRINWLVRVGAGKAGGLRHSSGLCLRGSSGVHAPKTGAASPSTIASHSPPASG